MLAPFVVLCGMLILKRLVFGLGRSPITGGLPPGALDLVRSADRHRLHACGGWALAWAVYVFNRGEYHPGKAGPCWRACSAIRWAVSPSPSMLAVTGTCPCFYLPGHFNTSLRCCFERTAVCMTIYIRGDGAGVCPVLLEKFGWKASMARLNKIMFFILALGFLLPTMHQSSMGSLMIVAGRRSIRSGKASCCRSFRFDRLHHGLLHSRV